ncbi:MAG TPA: hypothetical protein VF531_11790 [Bacillota bacterium]
MTKTVENLLRNSGLPGPRGNLRLMYSFAHQATRDEINECLAFYNDKLANSPEEFVVMCGIVGYCVLNQSHLQDTLTVIRGYASHQSWRIREAVAMGIQEIASANMEAILDNLENWLTGDELEKRAVVAALCEPKLLLGEKAVNLRIVNILAKLALEFAEIDGKLSENQNALRKALGYGWSVVIVAIPDEGKAAFEGMAGNSNKHIQWIVKENLKKHRLQVMDKKWVEKMMAVCAEKGDISI